MSERNTFSGVTGLLTSLLGTIADGGRTRLALAATELEEERLRLAQLLLHATVALFLLGVGLVLGCLWLVWMAPPTARPWVFGAVALGFLLAAALALWRWRFLANAKPPLLHASLGELTKDVAALRQDAS